MRDGTLPRAHGVTIDLLSAPHVGGFRGDMSFRVLPSRTDDVGFTFDGLWPDERYTVREFDADPLKPVVIVGLRMNGVALHGDDIVAPAVNATPQVLEVILDWAVVITGTLPQYAAGRVTAYRVSGGAAAAVSGDSFTADLVDGRFVLRGLPPGTYDVIGPGTNAARRVRVGAGEVIDLTSRFLDF